MMISLQNNGAAGLKMWEAEVTPQGVTIRYGPVGRKPRTQNIPLSACTGGSAMEEAIKRAQSKRNEGYWDVDPGQNASGSTTGQPAAKPSSVKSGATLDAIESNDWF